MVKLYASAATFWTDLMLHFFFSLCLPLSQQRLKIIDLSICGFIIMIIIGAELEQTVMDNRCLIWDGLYVAD